MLLHIYISNEKFSSLSSLALIHKSIKFTTVMEFLNINES